MSKDLKALIESTKYADLNESQATTLEAIMEHTALDTEKQLAEGTIASDVAQFTPFLMPMLRRVYPALIANELLGMQPLSGPTGFIYSLTNRYLGNAQHGLTGKAGTNLTQGGPSQYSITNAQTQVVLVKKAKAVQGGTVTDGTTSAVVVYVEPTNHGANVNWPAMNLNNLVGGKDVGSQGKVANEAVAVLVELPAKTAGGVQARLTVGTDVFASFSGSAAFDKILPNFSGAYTTANGETRGVVNNEMSEVGIAVERTQVEAKTRKLRAEYTIEMYQDLKAMHGVLADQELMNLMGYEIKAETDREVVDFVNAKAKLESDYFLNGGGAAAKPGAGEYNYGRWEIERYRALGIKIADMSREIGRRNKTGAANKLLVSPKILTVLEAIGSFQTAPQASTANANNISPIAGRFDNKFNVIVDNYADQGEYVTALYKGSNQDAMGVYAPYTPVQIQKVEHVTTGQPALIAMTRYGLCENPFGGDQYATTMGVDFSATVLG
jgi:hypothetical protein